MNTNDYPDEPDTQTPLPPANDYLLRLRARELKVLEVKTELTQDIIDTLVEVEL
jgi:hypothetical protein